MKILQLNIWGGRLGTQISELIRAEKPDVVCLQEVIDTDYNIRTLQHTEVNMEEPKSIWIKKGHHIVMTNLVGM